MPLTASEQVIGLQEIRDSNIVVAVCIDRVSHRRDETEATTLDGNPEGW